MKKKLNYFLLVTTSTESFPDSPFAEFQQHSRVTEAKFCIETKRKHLTKEFIQNTMQWMQDEFNMCFEEDQDDMRVKLDINNYQIYPLQGKPKTRVLIVHA